MRVRVQCVRAMPYGVAVWLVPRPRAWVLYVTEEVMNGLGGQLPDREPVSITPHWRVGPGL